MTRYLALELGDPRYLLRYEVKILLAPPKLIRDFYGEKAKAQDRISKLDELENSIPE